MVGTGRWLAMALILCGGLYACAVSAAEATLDRDTVGLGQSFVLTIESGESDDPDLSPLSADFDILGTSKRSQISIFNGHFKKSSSWLINLIAKREGGLVIPPLKVGSEQTAALTIHIVPGGIAGKAQDQDVFLELEVTPRDPYVQAQCLYTLRVLADSRLDIDDFNLGDPKIDAGAAIIKKLGKDKITKATRGDKHYDVLERVYAIYPQRDGEISIPPVIFQGQISRSGGLLLDPFSGAMNTRRLQSEAVTLHVKPVPGAFAGRTWLPAKSLQIHETWSDDPEDLKAGEPATRTISLLSNGLTAAQLPELDTALSGTLKTYADQPLLDDQIRPSGITGLRQQKIAVIASAGDIMLPEIRIPWWNTDTDHLEEAVLPARTLHVNATAASSANSQPGTVSPTAPPVQPEPDSRMTSPAGVSTPARWLTIAMGLGWLLTMLAWWRSVTRQQQIQAQVFNARRQKESGLLKTVLAACAVNAPAQARTALLAWARARWPEHPPQGLSDVAAREPTLAKPLDELNSKLYANGEKQWQGYALADALKKLGRVTTRSQTARSTPALEPLFRA